jgi:hypothetical protein
MAISDDGHQFFVDIADTHKVVHKSHLSCLENIAEQQKRLRGSFNRLRFSGQASPHVKTLIATIAAAALSFALSTLAFIMPLIVGAFLVDHGVLEYAKFNLIKFCSSFPSEKYLRSTVIAQAAECTLVFAKRLEGMKVYISCDKGNKKGVGHFVKYLSYWNGQQVIKELLDLNASGGTTYDCAVAIRDSLKKVFGGDGEDSKFVLWGQTTDSGGGGVLDGLAKHLKDLQLCNDEEYLVAACGIHNLQLQLANPIKELIGEGGLESRNMMQMMHCAYDLQESLNWVEFMAALEISIPFVKSYLNGTVNNAPQDEEDCIFHEKMMRVLQLRNFAEVETLWPNTTSRPNTMVVCRRVRKAYLACLFVALSNYPSNH